MAVFLPAERLEKALGYVFSEPALLKQALTHRSHSAVHNERLEFVGDGILNALVARALFSFFPDLPEGDLSRIRARLVCQEGLAEIAFALKLGEFIRLGEGELKSGGFRRPSILADALEAVLGAIWLDGGLQALEPVIAKLFMPRIAAIDPATAGKDPKTALQEWLQARKQDLPQYVLLAMTGESPEQLFEVSCSIPKLRVITIGKSTSKRAAEQQAAGNALQQLRETFPGKKLVMK
ncbi:ribonuclease III [Chitinilyticum piscinae]|uniref:Ribonuclease 3 n=1 Tax=Chitinilyticum piscinae TaxID=2866724 RepID=A0A8J7FN96_9NEIS|nr:ribonuclease III [Chitinilyticum piscinae]MBE9609811.1 ribonuclease III [Chitinilyticum piscinae]